MNDLHKPLGNEKQEKPSGKWKTPAVVAVAIGLIALTAYLVMEGREANRVRIAVNDKDTTPATSSGQLPQPRQQSAMQPEVSAPEKPELKSLAPEVSVNPQSAENPQPAPVSPRSTKPSRLHPVGCQFQTLLRNPNLEDCPKSPMAMCGHWMPTPSQVVSPERIDWPSLSEDWG